MAKENKNNINIEKVVGIIISVAILAFLVLILYIIFNNIPLASISSVATLSVSDNIVADNNSAQTLSEIPLTDVTTTAHNTTWLQLNGEDEYINTTQIDIFENLTNISVSMWVNITSNASSMRLFSNSEDGVNTPLQLSLTSSRLLASFTRDLGTTDTVTSTNRIHLNEWTHIVLWRNSSDTTFYINGTQDSGGFQSWNSSTSATTTIALKIGVLGNGTAFFLNSSIDEIRIYNDTLTDDEITEIYNSGRVQNSSLTTDNLDLWMPINENSGTVIHTLNETETSIDADNINTSTWDTDGINTTLTLDTDYTVLTDQFTIINLNYAWNQLTVTYFIASTIRNDFTNIQGNYSLSLLNISIQFPTVGTIIGITFLLLILIGLLIFVIRRMMNVTTTTGNNGGGSSKNFSGSSQEFG